MSTPCPGVQPRWPATRRAADVGISIQAAEEGCPPGGVKRAEKFEEPQHFWKGKCYPHEAPTHRLMERGDTFGAFSQQNHPPPRPVLLSAFLCCLSSAANVLSSVWASPPPGSWVLALPLFLRTALSLPARGRLYVLSAVRPPRGACVPGFHQSLCHVTSGDRW